MTLLCSICDTVFGPEDVKERRFVVSTGVCVECYRRGREDPNWCYGKQYDGATPECSRLCPDRLVCKLVSQGVTI